MSLLIDGDIDYIRISESHNIKINTDFRLWLFYLKSIQEKDSVNLEISLRLICPDAKEITQELLEGLREYFCSTVTKNETPISEINNTSKITNFDIFSDEELIIADFTREYNINLLDNSLMLSWRRFNILLNNLSDNSSVSSRVRLRDMDLKDIPKKDKERVRRLKAKYSIKNKSNGNKISLEERNTILKEYVKQRGKEIKICQESQ